MRPPVRPPVRTRVRTRDSAVIHREESAQPMPFFVFLFFTLIAVLGFLAQMNTDRVSFFVTRQTSFEMPVMALVLFSSAIGGIVVMLAIGVRETKSLFTGWKYARLQKKEVRINAYYTDAVNALLARRHSDAIGFFQKILALNPNHINTLLRLGKIHRIDKNFSEAIRLHQRAHQMDAANIEVLLALSRDMEETQRFEDAIHHLKRVLHLDETHATALSHLREIYVRFSRWEEAHAVQEKIMKLPSTPGTMDVQKKESDTLLGIQYEMGVRLAEAGQQDRARHYFKDAIKRDKMFLPAHIGLAELHIREGKLTLAARLLEKGYEMTGQVLLLHRLEDLYLEMGEPERILRAYQNAVSRAPQDRVLRFYLGKLYYRLEMIDDAYDLLSEIEPQVEYFPDLHKVLGNLHLRRGELNEAVLAFKRGLKLKKRVLVPYFCADCDHHTTEWSGRCGRCGRWNSYRADPILVDKAPKEVNALPPYWPSHIVL